MLSLEPYRVVGPAAESCGRFQLMKLVWHFQTINNYNIAGFWFGVFFSCLAAMQAVAVARACVLVALALFLAGDLASLLYRLTSFTALHQETSRYSSATTQLGHHTNAIPRKFELYIYNTYYFSECFIKNIVNANIFQL